MCRSCTFMRKYSAEIECSRIYEILEREKCVNDLSEIKKVWKLKENQRKEYYDNKYKIIMSFLCVL